MRNRRAELEAPERGCRLSCHTHFKHTRRQTHVDIETWTQRSTRFTHTRKRTQTLSFSLSTTHVVVNALAFIWWFCHIHAQSCDSGWKPRQWFGGSCHDLLPSFTADTLHFLGNSPGEMYCPLHTEIAQYRHDNTFFLWHTEQQNFKEVSR